MVGGRVQGVEAMIFVLDFRPVGDGEANLAKTAHDVFRHLGQRMKFAQRHDGARAR